MLTLLLGLVLFLGAHTVVTLRPQRAALIKSVGEGGYKAAYSVVSLVGFVLIVWGFSAYRASGMVPVWSPPIFMQHIAATLMLPAMILLVAAYAPVGMIKARAKHPMLAAVKIWAFAHLLSNGDLGSIVLFGAFLAWAVYDRIALKRRGAPNPAFAGAWGRGDTIAVALGAAVWLAMLFGVHRWLIGVPAIAGLGV